MKDLNAAFFKNILDGINSLIYVTDADTDEIVYMNDHLKEIFHINNYEGLICWKALQNQKNERCDFCKISKLKTLDDHTTLTWREVNSITGRTYTNYDKLIVIDGHTYHVQNSIDITDQLRLSTEATIDELTGILNRNAGKKRLGEMLKEMQTDQNFTIVLYDVNGLKWVNDTYGHLEGDHLLSFIAHTIKNELDSDDLIFRLSGDEFVIGLMNKDTNEANSWMQRVQEVIKVKQQKSRFNYDVSFSYGLAPVYPSAKLTVSDLLSLADTQMYMQKRKHHIQKNKDLLQQNQTYQKPLPAFQYNKDYLFDILSESVDDYIFVGNLKTGRFMYSYKMMLDFDLPDQILDNAAVFWGEKIHPDDFDLFLNSNQEIADGRAERHTIVYRAKNVNNQYVHLMCRGQMVRDAQGVPDLFAGIIRNLDKKEENDNEELRIISDSSTDGIFKASMTEGFPILYANDGYYEIHGYTKKQFAEELNNHAADVVLPEDMDRVQKDLQEGIKQNKIRIIFEYRIKRRDGKIRWVHVNAGFVSFPNSPNVLIGMIMDITERKELEERLIRTEQLFNIAVKHSNLNMWEFDILNKRIIFTKDTNKDLGFGMITHNIPDSLIENKLIHPDSIQAFKEFHNQLGINNDVSTVEIRAKTQNSKQYNWIKIIYRIVSRVNNKATWAIGISEDITAQKEAEIRIFKEAPMIELLESDLIFSFRINITQDKVEDFWDHTNKNIYHSLKEEGYLGIFNHMIESIAHEGDLLKYKRHYHFETIQELINNNERIPEFEFRLKHNDGSIIWATLTLKAMISPESHDKYIFGYVRNIDAIKKKELSLKQKIETDEVSGFYNLATARLLIKDIIKSSNQNDYCLFMLLDVDDFNKINQLDGFLIGDEILKNISQEINKKLTSSYIKARINGDLFLIFYYGTQNPNDTLSHMKQLRTHLSRQYYLDEQKLNVTLSVGAVIKPLAKGLTYEQLYQFASYALSVAKKEGKNRFISYHDIINTDNHISKNSQVENEGQNIFNFLKYNWHHADYKQEPRFTTLTFLNYVGHIFDLHQILIYRTQEKQNLVLEQTWKDNQYVQNDNQYGNPCYLEELFQSISPTTTLIINNENSQGYTQIKKIYGTKPVPLPLIITAVYDEDQIAMILVLENVKKNQDMLNSLALGMEIIYRSNRIESLWSKYEYAIKYDKKTGVLNYDSYMNFLKQANDDTYSTFGIISVHIIDLNQYNQTYGHKSGDELLQFTANTFVDIFNENLTFRISGAEFRTLCPDMTYDYFLKQYHLLKEKLEERFPGSYAFEKVWEQSTISIDRLHYQLDEKILVACNVKKDQSDNKNKKTLSIIQEEILQAIQNKNFCVFFQPKANVKANTICGAEALIRYNHPEKGIIPPGRFLPSIEKVGLVRYIDIFVLEEVCRIIKEWIEQGWEPFPISLNYSRTTILEADILYKTNQIVENAGIPKNLIEIEITESISSIDSESLKDIVNQFVNEGYRVILDDFGSEYSSLYTLYSLQLSALKLDRRIVNDIYHNHQAQVVIKNIINICKELNISCVAEGVETKEHLEALQNLSCDIMQGYYFNKPLSEDEFKKQYIHF